MKIRKEEINALLKCDAKKRYKYFINHAADSEVVWSLYDDGWISSENDEGDSFFILWPEKEFAELCISGNWKNCYAKKIELHFLINEILPNLSNEKTKVAIFMLPNGDETPSVSADELMKDLKNECQKYE